MPTLQPEHRDNAPTPRSNAQAALRAAGVDLTHAHCIFVPGRIEFLGKHTDYAGGRSLLCAVERGIDFVYVPRADPLIRIFHPATGARIEFALDAQLIPSPAHWSNYPMTVARRVAHNFPGPLRGVDVAFDSNLPLAAGLSSSSALIVGMFLVLSHANALDHRPEYQSTIDTTEDLAGYLGTVENGQSYQNGAATLAGDRGVGTLGGSQDHTAILCSTPGQLRQYSFFPVRYEASAPLPNDYKLVVACCGIEAQKTGAAQAAYNRNPLIVRRLLELWNNSTRRSDPCLAAAVRSDPTAADRLRQIIHAADPGEFNCGAGIPPAEFSPLILLDRLNQFIEESERIIPAAANALRTGDLVQLGHLVDESQQWAQRGLGNQLPHTIFLAQAARQAGAVAASAFGAGFGGSVWALVPQADIDAFQAEWLARYRRAFPIEGERAGTFVTGAGTGARWP